ncbi:DKNYY domain-containing protein [Pseudomonas sp. F1_0610]|uniref:DKNYY domain-containing protein n=1 Tax=Pseudomonas sp. F1_0610 TaxID=3114284 RepID=UPI0039C31A60
MSEPSSISMEHEGERISNSIFINYQGQIYASVPSNGYHLIKQADPASFKLIATNSQRNTPFAIDQQQAYCGNKSIANFSPTTAVYLGNDYFTDGHSTIYCAPFTEQNLTLSSWQNLVETWLYGLGLGEKPQVYFYPLVRLPNSSTPYKALLKNNLATNGSTVFFRGKLMPDAQPEQIKAVNLQDEDKRLRSSHNLYQDDNFVYYHNYKLPIPSSKHMYSFNVGNLFKEHYLFDPTTGNVAMNNLVFNTDYAPYQIMSHHGGHVNHVLLLSKHGVYFYDQAKEKIKRAGDNPFPDGNWQEIAPLIFIYNNHTYFLQDSSISGQKRHSTGLVSRSTSLYQLEENTTDAWEKIADIHYGRYGQIWRKGKDYYFFDKLGKTQLSNTTLYRIANQTAVKLLLNQANPNDIRKMIKEGALVRVSAKKIFQAKSQYRNNFLDFSD